MPMQLQQRKLFLPAVTQFQDLQASDLFGQPEKRTTIADEIPIECKTWVWISVGKTLDQLI